MDENLKPGDMKKRSKCEDSDQPSEQMGRNENKKSISKVDVPPTGIVMKKLAAGSVENDNNSLKKAVAQSIIKCEICSCEMSSDSVLSSHLNGSRHKKRMKALEIVANLKAAGEEGVGLQSDSGVGAYRCEICSLTVNSPQQLEIHLAGSKHKNRMTRDKLFNIVVSVPPINSRAASENDNDCPPSKKRKKDDKVLFCDICNISLNSKVQYEQHVISKKHLGRTNLDRKKRLSRLENKPNVMRNFTARNQFHSGIEGDINSCQLITANQPYLSNRSRIHQVHSQVNNRRDVGFNKVNCLGMNNESPFRNYYQQRPFLNSHRNIRNNFCRIPETGTFVSKSRPQLLNYHSDSVLQSSLYNS